jgi:hypothetical protein
MNTVFLPFAPVGRYGKPYPKYHNFSIILVVPPKIGYHGLACRKNLLINQPIVPNANGIGSATSLRGVNHDVNVSGENGTVQYYFNDAPVASNQVI